MKATFSAFSLLAALLLGVLSVFQWSQTVALKAQVGSLQEALAARGRELEAEGARIKELKRQQADARSDVWRLNSQLATLRMAGGALPGSAPSAESPSPAAAPPAEPQGGFGEMLGKMMRDPAMKKMIRQQQVAMMDLMYGPLFKDLRLSAEETEKFKEVLLDRQMKGVEHAGALLKPADGSADRAEAMEALTQQQKDSEEQLKALLGEDRFAQYTDYTQTMGERMLLNQFTQQMASGPHALTEDQTHQLLEIMKAEKTSVSAESAGSEQAASPGQGGLEAIMSEEQMEKAFAQQDEVGRRVRERAATMLTPEQLQSFGSFQTNQLEMARMSMTMAVKLFGAQKAKEPPSAPPGPP